MSNSGNSLSDLLTMSHSTVVDNSSTGQMIMRFCAETDTDIFTENFELIIGDAKLDLFDVIEKVKGGFDEARAVMPFSGNTFVIRGVIDGHPVLLHSMDRTHHHDDDEVVISRGISFYGFPAVVRKLKAYLETTFEATKMAKIVWWTRGIHGDNNRTFFLPKEKLEIKPEYYPNIGDAEQYINDYLDSKESVLLMTGPPGTDKTTLLRHMISSRHMCAHIVYDEALLEKDTVFQSFLFNDEAEILIIEDADTILSSRERDGNALMSRFLNISDGLIKLPNKKLVFTTNITDTNKIDDALMRPGRCFGVMQTRHLDLAEAQAAAKAAGLPIPMEKRSYTIAELFNQGKRTKARSFGFGVSHG